MNAPPSAYAVVWVVLTFSGNDAGSLQVAFIAGQQYRSVECPARRASRRRLRSDAGDDVRSLLERASIGDGIDDDVAVDAAAVLAPDVRLLDKLIKLVSDAPIISAPHGTIVCDVVGGITSPCVRTPWVVPYIM